MSMGGAHGGGSWMTLRSFTRDDSVKNQRLAPGTMRRIGSFARPYARLIAVFLVAVVLDAVLVVATPLLLRRIIDNGLTPPGNRQLVIGLAGLAGLFAVLDAGFSLVQRWLSARIGEGLIYDLRTRVFAHVQRMPLAFFTRTQTGALISRLNTDVMGAQQAFTSTLSGVVSNLVSLVLVAAAMFYLSWQITALSLVLVPLFLLPARWIGRRLAGLTRAQMQTNAELSATMTERLNVAGALLVKLYGRPAEEDAGFAGKASRVRDLGVRIAMASRVFFTGLTLVAALATALTYGVGGVLVLDHALTLGALLALTALLARLYGPLTSLANVRVDIMTALVSFERVFEVLDLPSMIVEKPDAAALPNRPATVEFRGVQFHYPRAEEVSLASLEVIARLESTESTQVLRGVDFTVEPGRMVALVGPSGAGKTTITSLVARLYDATEGQVRIGGYDVRDVTLASLHRLVGVVTQDAHLFHDTIRGNLVYARPGATDEDLLEACEAAQIGDLVRSLPEGLDTVVGDRGYRLSGGEKQRLALARLLLKAPGIVVLDEATAHLDSESAAAVQGALRSALAGRTSLVIAHRLSTVRDADQILVVDGGRVVQRGQHDELLAEGGLYADLYRTQFAGQARGGPDRPDIGRTADHLHV